MPAVSKACPNRSSKNLSMFLPVKPPLARISAMIGLAHSRAPTVAIARSTASAVEHQFWYVCHSASASGLSEWADFAIGGSGCILNRGTVGTQWRSNQSLWSQPPQYRSYCEFSRRLFGLFGRLSGDMGVWRRRLNGKTPLFTADWRLHCERCPIARMAGKVSNFDMAVSEIGFSCLSERGYKTAISFAF